MTQRGKSSYQLDIFGGETKHPPVLKCYPRATCPNCEREFTLVGGGVFRKHGDRWTGGLCAYSGRSPR